jgi:acyl-CoA thioesterase-1
MTIAYAFNKSCHLKKWHLSGIRFIFMLLSLFILSSCDQNKPVETLVKQKPTGKTFTILALGDSLTEGLGVAEKDSYPSILQSKLAKNIQVINAGLSGETSSGLKNRLNWVLKQNPDLVILNIGANDAMRGLPIELTQTNIDEIITTIKQSNADVILAGMQIYENLGKDYVDKFVQIYPTLSQKHHIPLIPFFLAHVAGKPEFNQKDMLHPNAQGYEIIVEQNILPILSEYLNL